MRNVMLIGGIYHPFEEAAATLAALLSEQDIESVITSDVDEAVEELVTADMFTLYALRWRMLNHDKYIPFRAKWAYELPESHAQRIEDFVDEGGAMLGLHTASICFDTWYEFSQLLGGVWRWEQTFHPPLGPVEIDPVAGHPATRNLSAFNFTDEIYHGLEIAPTSQILLRGRVPDGPWEPISWAQEVGAGRVVYSALGHDAASLEYPSHAQFLRQATGWLMGEES